jgi:Na+-translocating ferredoxin:NAD+ oxidoreductase RnfC subunit
LPYDRDAPLVPFTIPLRELRVPLKMHIGAPCQAAVAKGEAVKKGAVIGIPQGLGAFIHAPADAVVAEVNSGEVVLKVDG